MMVRFGGLHLALLFIASTRTVGASGCSVEKDDIRLFGSGGDAGRVELCQTDGTWRYVCASRWDLETATVACRQLGYQTAFMADSAVRMAFTGGAATLKGVHIGTCRGDERTLRDCQHHNNNATTKSVCTLQEAVGAACSTASSRTAQSTYPTDDTAMEEEIHKYMKEMEEWWSLEQERQHSKQQQLLAETTEEEFEECSAIPNPFHDVQAIQEAFLFPDSVTQIYQNMSRQLLIAQKEKHNETMTQLLLLLQETLEQIHMNALGMDLSALFPPPMTLQQVQSKLQQQHLTSIRDLYLSSNQHNALHWFLDAPYRYYSQPAQLLTDPKAQSMFDTLQRDGILLIDNFGGDIDRMVELAEEALSGEALDRKNETAIAGGGSIWTSRRPMLPLEDVLLHNQTLQSVIQAYLGPSLLHGYKVVKLTHGLTSTNQYNAGMYHHDRAGRRLKLFYFLHDVHCDTGHPTQVAATSHKLLYYKTEEYPVTRVTDRFVNENYDIIKGCGTRGGGFLFDTHTLHKGTVTGHHERTVAIAEYHHVAKCAYSQEHGLGLPCPAGDLYRTNKPL